MNKKIVCAKCKKRKNENEFYPSRLKRISCVCKECCKKYLNDRYHTNATFRKKRLDAYKEQQKTGYFRKHYRKKRLGNPEAIRELCQIYKFGKKATEAIALDGILLDKELKKKGVG